ncbi:Nop8p SCDLUD_004984 [Saccharomycodes ludwigii]|uniref:Nop8p n=1 Tax=Saccharomycodes ludwigii TaxID=36035 RepID=UPI001E87C5BC|nr:hypothetical protein SCDLUD_004984 [Saccharomycodes ludwigii]KAH3898662.1 hypothetical protein SCDLUD_004984 [Saccharomycodes ludwigii]
MSLEKRIYVGNLYSNIHECCNWLYPKFSKFGDLKSDCFEEHEHFAYITIEFKDEIQYGKLKSQFNNVKFMGNNIIIDLAKEDYKTRWERENKDYKLNKTKKEQILKHQWEYYKKLENIKMSWKDRREIIPGRMREKPRSTQELKNVTFRVFNKRGQLKVYKCYKDKLWGYDKKKTVRDLVFSFQNKYWKDGNNHIVEKLDYSKSKVFFKNGDSLAISLDEKSTTSRGGLGEKKVHGLEEEGHEYDNYGNDFGKEHNKNNSILNSVLGNFNFETPLDIKQADEEYGSSDYEFQHQFNSDDDDEDDEEKEEEEEEQMEIKKPKKNDKTFIQQNSSEKQGYNGDTQEAKDDILDVEKSQSDIDEEEFIPKFPAQPQGNINSTETLRGIFEANTNEVPSFQLIEENNDDIDHEKDLKEENNTTETNVLVDNFQTANKAQDFGLFFPHFDSYFLAGQTQIAKIGIKPINEDFTNWDETFWKNRGVWTKEMKERKRDAIRKWKKKSHKNDSIILL